MLPATLAPPLPERTPANQANLRHRPARPQGRRRVPHPTDEGKGGTAGTHGRRVAAFRDRRGMAERGGLVGQGSGARAAIQGHDHEDGAAAYRRKLSCG